MFDISGLWVLKHLMGDLQLPDKSTMAKVQEDWVKRNKAVTDWHEIVDFQADYVMDLVRDCGEDDFPYNIDVRDMLHEHIDRRDEDIVTYRDYSYTSKYTGTRATIPRTSFMMNKDDSLENFLNQEEVKCQRSDSVTAILEKRNEEIIRSDLVQKMKVI